MNRLELHLLDEIAYLVLKCINWTILLSLIIFLLTAYIHDIRDETKVIPALIDDMYFFVCKFPYYEYWYTFKGLKSIIEFIVKYWDYFYVYGFICLGMHGHIVFCFGNLLN
jgi:hypothetical protein